jgi:hypothetical protein
MAVPVEMGMRALLVRGPGSYMKAVMLFIEIVKQRKILLTNEWN